VTRVLVIDNYDSFVYTLNGYLRELGASTEVVRNDDIPVQDLPARLAEYDAVLISPGPGGVVTNAEELMHGKTSQVTHDGSPFYDGVGQPFTATRYHSLAVVDGTVPDDLVITARTAGGVIMGLRHREAPIYGVQFHPESVLTEGGYRMLGNWLEVAGLAGAAEKARGLNPLVKLA
jgi:para-aminobenzoate synthetase component 2